MPATSAPTPRVPMIDGPAWQLCVMPDLGPLAGRKQDIVDHGLIQAADGVWQLWACIRGTAVSRLLFGWEGQSLRDGPWRPLGVVARADPAFGEQVTAPDGRREEAIGAPFFFRDGPRWLCFYHSGTIRLMESADGRNYQRVRLPGQSTNVLFQDGGRDAMVLKRGPEYYVYSCHTTADEEWVALHISRDLRHWSDEIRVQQGGRAGTGHVTHESPFVVEIDGYFYLFRASSMDFKTYVYRSLDPQNFGLHDDRCLIAEMPIKAPELLLHDGQWHITDLADFQGIRIAPLRWE